jgi:cation transport ATPase
MFIETGTNQGQFLTAFFSLEAACNHPFAAAIESHPWYNEIQKAKIGDFKLHPGLGVCGTIRARDRREFFAAVGSLRFLKRLQMFISRDMKNQVEDLEAMGETVLLCGYDGQVKGIMSFSDVLRPQARSVLNRIKHAHIEPAIVTGDSEEAIAHLANSVGIKKVYSRCTPDEKASKIQREVAEGRMVGIVGSEDDDPECFKAAQVGISVDIGTRFHDTPSILLMGSDLRLVSWLITQAQKHRRLTQVSFLVSLGVAALGLVGLPWISMAHLNILAALSLAMNLVQNVVTHKLTTA